MAAMDWLVDLFTTGSVPGSVLLIALVAALGLAIGSVRVRGASLGIAGVLFAGLLLGHLGVVVEPVVLEFARDFGLVLFVYAIGVAVGPGFFAPLRRHGIGLNLISVGNVVLGSVLAALVGRIAQTGTPVAVGILAGASTNTPSLGAAQTALRDIPGYTEQLGQLPALGYAVSYPFGVVGVILAMLLARPLFRGSERKGAGLLDTVSADGTGSDSDGREVSPEADRPGQVQVMPIFIGIGLGVLIGSIPVPVQGLPAPLRLGLAGGPLVVAILLSARERIGPFTWRTPAALHEPLRDIGIVMFLACVGIIAGRRFVETIAVGDGLRWMAWGTAVTFIPTFSVALVGRAFFKGGYPSTCGLMAGCTTNPVALAFAATSTQAEAVTLAYATVYPLTMVLRVLSTQLFVLLLM
jgi:AspT/YidE/YbjL antiporter-like protein